MKSLLSFLLGLSLLLSTQTSFAKITYDLGVSAGSTAGESYTEANLGVNWFMKEWLVWRNSGFARFPSGELEDVYGLDTSMRAYKVNELGETSRLTLFVGPGYRFASVGNHVAFAEAGVHLMSPALSIGLGAKTFFNKIGDADAATDTQYFIILSGSGTVGE